MRAILYLICLSFGLAIGTSHAATFFQYTSQPGDYIGQGRQGTLAAPAYTFTPLAPFTGEDVYIQIAGTTYWSVSFAAPSGQPLAAGSYPMAEQRSASGHPRLNVDGEARGCNNSFGHFTVLEIAYDASHKVTSLAADFEQHCEGMEPALYGAIRFNSSIAYIPQPPPPLGPASIQLDSQFGDRIGGGVSRLIDRNDGIFGASVNFDGGVDLRVVSLPGAPPTFWTASFAPAAGQAFGPGVYENAEGFPPLSAGHPGLAVNGCSTSAGRFTVYEVEYGPIGTVTRFAADFEQHCEGDEPGLYGAVRYNSTRPYVTQQPAPYVPASIQIASEPGDWVGQGMSATFTRAQGFFYTHSGFGPGAMVQLRNVPGMPTFTWTLMFAPVAGQPFLPGTYENAERAPFNSAGHPGLSVGGERGCSTLTGRFIVYEVEYGPLDTLKKFAADFEQHCDGQIPALHGAVRYNSSIPYSPPALAPSPLGIRNVQDMWWNPSESGWGMSIVQHGDTLFNVIFAYDAQGNPTWFVMPGGTWNAAHTAFTGSVYRPHGSAFSAYDARQFTAGQPVGTATISFSGANFASMQYTIEGQAGTKLIERQRFGPAMGEVGEHTDMWWGGIAQNGWGLAIIEQSPKLFPIWYTYDASGNPRWFVMPVGEWTSSSVYEGRIFRTTGSPWVGRDYDRTQLHAFDAGSFALRFDGDSARFDYSIDGGSGSIPMVRQPF